MPKKRGKTSLKKRRSFQWIPTRKNKANVAPGAEVFDGESKEIPALAADDKEEGGENPGVVAASEGEKTPRAAASEGENAPSRRGGAWRTFAISVRGATHIKNDKPKQDAAGSRDPETISEDDGERRFAWAIVADGHGGDDYFRSDRGARFAVEATEACFRVFLRNASSDFCETPARRDDALRRLTAAILGLWNRKVEEDWEANPAQEEEFARLSERSRRKVFDDKRFRRAYGTTLIAVAVADDYWFAIQNGDGKCVAVDPEGAFKRPIPRSDKCFLNATTSLCDEDAGVNFRFFASKKLPTAVFVGTDGVDDCFGSDERLDNFYRTILYSFSKARNDGDFELARAELAEYLPRLSEKGSGDDASLAAIFDFERIGAIPSVAAFDVEREKARVAEKARREAEEAENERRREETKYASREETRRRVNATPSLCPNPQCSKYGRPIAECVAQFCACRRTPLKPQKPPKEPGATVSSAKDTVESSKNGVWGK